MAECLPLSQNVILRSRDQVPNWDPHREPASPSAYVSAFLCVSHEEINIFFKRITPNKRLSHFLLPGIVLSALHWGCWYLEFARGNNVRETAEIEMGFAHL